MHVCLRVCLFAYLSFHLSICIFIERKKRYKCTEDKKRTDHRNRHPDTFSHTDIHTPKIPDTYKSQTELTSKDRHTFPQNHSADTHTPKSLRHASPSDRIDGQRQTHIPPKSFRYAPPSDRIDGQRQQQYRARVSLLPPFPLSEFLDARNLSLRFAKLPKSPISHVGRW